MVTDITPDPVVTVVTNKATFKAKQLVITAGAWAPTLLKKLGIHLPFKVIIRHLTLFMTLGAYTLPSDPIKTLLTLQHQDLWTTHKLSVSINCT